MPQVGPGDDRSQKLQDPMGEWGDLRLGPWTQLCLMSLSVLVGHCRMARASSHQSPLHTVGGVLCAAHGGSGGWGGNSCHCSPSVSHGHLLAAGPHLFAPGGMAGSCRWTVGRSRVGHVQLFRDLQILPPSGPKPVKWLISLGQQVTENWVLPPSDRALSVNRKSSSVSLRFETVLPA